MRIGHSLNSLHHVSEAHGPSLNGRRYRVDRVVAVSDRDWVRVRVLVGGGLTHGDGGVENVSTTVTTLLQD